MHDELIERRLRSALRERGDALSFTITAAELERRMALRRRSGATSRLTFLVAAAIAIGVIGAGAIVGGLSNKPTATTAPAAVATQASGTPPPIDPSAPVLLPTLDELIAVDPARVLVAQAYGPAEGPADPISEAVQQSIPIASLGDLQAGGDYALSVACLGPVPLEVGLEPVGSSAALNGLRFPCDGFVHETIVPIRASAAPFIWYRDTTSWRVVIRGDRRQPPLPTANPGLPPLPEGVDELVRVEDATVEAAAEAWGTSGLGVRQIGAVPARVVYAAEVWCDAGATIRLLFADRFEAALIPAIETVVACDGLVHELGLPLPLPNGSPIFVAATPTTRWSVSIASATPPVALARDVPGWQEAGGIGPSLHFEATEVSFSDVAGEDGGPLMVVIECAGPDQDIEVNVDIEGILGDAFQSYTAACTPEGRRSSFTFDTASTGYIVRHEAPAGTWTALSLLIPEPPSGP